MTMEPILLVDDENDLRTMLKDSLIENGFRVEDAPDVSTALALMAQRHYPVVLTDLNMPGGPTGFDLLQEVKARDPLTLCVVITGYASMETAIQAVKFGAYDFVQKPFKLAEIQAVLDRALNHAHVLSQLGDYQRDLETRVMTRVQDLQGYQEEVIKLNDLLLAAQDEEEERSLLKLFMDYLQERFQLQGHAILLPAPENTWKPLTQEGAPPEFPAPSSAQATQPWGQGWFVPLRRGQNLLAGIYLEFPSGSAFHPEDRVFLFWLRQAEAALHGLLRARTLVPGRP